MVRNDCAVLEVCGTIPPRTSRSGGGCRAAKPS